MALVRKRGGLWFGALGATAVALLLVVSAGTANAAATTSMTTTTASSSEPMVSNIAATSTNAAAVVTWTTDEPATSQVAYGTSSAYTASTTLDSTLMTTHAATLGNLAPATAYHYQVISADAAGSSTASLDQTFMTLASSSPATSTPPAGTSTSTASTTAYLSLSAYSAAPGGSVVALGSGFTPLETVWLSFASSTNAGNQNMASSTASTTLGSTTADQNGTFSFPFAAPNTSQGMFTVWASGATSGLTATNTLYIEPAGTSTGTSTATSTDLTSLQNEITQLQNEVSQLQSAMSQLQAQVQSLLSGTGTSTGGGAGNPPPPANMMGQIDQNGQTVSAGGGIDFGGHNFGSNEHVSVMLNGSQVGQAFTNTAGSFSTGSMSVPATPGTYTYTFVGQQSGISGQATITVT